MKKILTIALCIVIGITVLSGCGRSNNEDSSDGILRGSIATDGSTSIKKVIGSLGESFMNKEKEVVFTYNPTGSGAGIAAVLEGRCDIGLSSRALKEEEKASGLKETVFAYDGIALIVNPQNKISDLSLEQIAKIYTGEISNWKELGGDDREIVLIGREAGSGTREGFETVTDTKNKCKYRQELTSSGDIITTVLQNPNAIGYASIASVKKSVKLISVDGVMPSEETIKNGTYKVQRPFVLVTKMDAPMPQATKRFFEYITSPDSAHIISKAGAVSAN